MGRPTTNVLDFARIKEEERLSLEREREFTKEVVI